MDFETLSSDIVFHGRVFDVRQDLVRLPDGNETILDIVQHNDAVTIVPIDADGQIWMIRQYRQAAGKTILELPAGAAESGEDTYISASRELREEIGHTAENIQKLGTFYLAPGYSSEYMHVYLATNLRPDPLPGDADEFIDIVPMKVEKVFAAAMNGEILDAKTLAALLLARPYLE